jgi:ubiquinone/menaquinone biosynthesis C-methylase UbiE
MMSSFDASASTFERYRPLPTDAPEAIRAAIWSAIGLSAPMRVLDIGAGTGRFGRAFVAAGDSYVGVDTSLAMLQEFQIGSANCTLLQADGRRLPFENDFFDVVLMMQILSTIDDWQGVVMEARRVLRRGGCLVVGHSVSPESGIDMQLKRRLKGILKEMDVDSPRPEQSRREALAWLESAAVRRIHSVATSWSVNATPEEFLQRHRTGARFAALPPEVQEQALERLRSWAEQKFGSINATFPETRSFEVDIFEF